MRRPALLPLLALLLAVPAVARADGSLLTPVAIPATDLADATGAVAPSAAAGHVVFSRSTVAGGRFELVDRAPDGTLRVLPVGDRAVPFDADVGPGGAGGAVVVFSRCTTDAVLTSVLPTADFTGARGCSVQILDLDRAGARPHALRLAHAGGLSLTTPSVRLGAVAAVAAPGRGAADPRVLLWRRTSQAPVRLRGGTTPACPYRSCSATPRAGVDALDLGARSVAFTWRLSEPGIGAGAAVELRSSSLRPGAPGHRVGSAAGYVSGACGFRQPLSPHARSDGGLAFLLAQSPCDVVQTTLAVQRPTSAFVLGARPAGFLAYGAAYDGSRVYWLRGAVPPPQDAGAPVSPSPVPCAAAACRLVVSSGLPLAPTTRRPR